VPSTKILVCRYISEHFLPACRKRCTGISHHRVSVCLSVCVCVCVCVSHAGTVKIQLTLIGSRPRAFQRAIDKPCTLPLSPPKGGTKRDFAIFPVNFKFCRKRSATKFLCVKTASSKLVATSFPYPTIHRRIAGDVPIYLKFALKVTHPRRKTSTSTDCA